MASHEDQLHMSGCGNSHEIYIKFNVSLHGFGKKVVLIFSDSELEKWEEKPEAFIQRVVARSWTKLDFRT